MGVKAVVALVAIVTFGVALPVAALAEDGVVDIAVAPLGGWWTVTDDGVVTAADGAPYYGDASRLPLVEPIVGMAATPSGLGYWLVASDGGVFTYGDAAFHGSAGAIDLWEPVVGMAATPSGLGYWLVASDGGLFTYGDATFVGSAGGIDLVQPIVAMAATDDGGGYWLLAADGGAFAFGNATFLGSAAVGWDPARRYVDGGTNAGGYWVARSDGEVAVFDATGRIAGLDPACDPDPVTAVAFDGGNWISVNEALEVPHPLLSADASLIDSASISDLLVFAQACQAVRPIDAFDLGAPLIGARRSSPFGERLHPIWGVVQLHSGQDLAIGAGTPVASAASGVVVGVRTQVAYGAVVIVDHGGRLATVYAHLASVAVAVGDVIGQGDAVGRVGSTGFATGAHLHYEIRHDGRPVDPAPYL